MWGRVTSCRMHIIIQITCASNRQVEAIGNRKCSKRCNATYCSYQVLKIFLDQRDLLLFYKVSP